MSDLTARITEILRALPSPVYVRFIDGWSLDGLKVKPGRRNLTVLWSPGAGE